MYRGVCGVADTVRNYIESNLQDWSLKYSDAVAVVQESSDEARVRVSFYRSWADMREYAGPNRIERNWQFESGNNSQLARVIRIPRRTSLKKRVSVG